MRKRERGSVMVIGMKRKESVRGEKRGGREIKRGREKGREREGERER